MNDPRKEAICENLPIPLRRVFDAMLARDLGEVRRCFHLSDVGAKAFSPTRARKE